MFYTAVLKTIEEHNYDNIGLFCYVMSLCSHNLPFSSTSWCFTFCLIHAWPFVCCAHLYCNCFFQVFFFFFNFLIKSFTCEELKVQVLQGPYNLKDGMVLILFRGKNRDVDHVLVVVTTTW